VQFFVYCLCGGIGVSTDFAVYYIAITSGFWYQGANILGYLAGTLISFALNRIFTFNMRDRILQRLILFIAIAAIGLSLSAMLLWLLVQVLHVDARLGKLLTLPPVILLQFSLNRLITFRSAPGNPA
jgi:putative flippase GtrA